MGGAEHTGEEVLSYKETIDGVIVKTTIGEYAAKQLIITAGPWLPELLNKQSGLSKLSDYFKIVRQVMYWFDIKEHYQNFKPGHFPIFIWEGYGDLASSYGFPAIDGPDGGLKMASPKFNEIVTPDTIDRKVSQAAIDEIYDAQVSKCFDGVGRTCLRTAVCMYTDTHDSRFVMGKLPGSNHTIIASPCSGHGFKHSPAIGECLAQLALDGASKLDISGFGVASIFLTC